MTFSAEQTQSQVLGFYANANVGFDNAVPATTTLFRTLGVDDQLAVLWFIYTEMGKSITPAAPGAARLQFAEGLLEQVKQLSHADQLQFMRDLVNKTSTPLTRAYGVLGTNTKLAFWFVLAELMRSGEVVPMPNGYQLARDGRKVLDAVRQLDMSQQITVLRNAVVNMGVDPF